ncbi:MAG TPA: hypothetical protein VGP80_07630 [Gemmatimonadales bacterium]|nr:hypothetical protein [Gemmatimonadales bacterium]
MPSMHSILSRPRFLAAATAVALVTACGLLDTQQPDIVDPGNLDNPDGAIAKAKGARSQFSLAKDGDGDLDEGVTEGEILLSGLMADEFVLSTTPPTEQEVDQLRVSTLNSSLSAIFLYLHRARAAAEDAGESLRKFGVDPDTDPLIPEMQNLAGFTYVYFAEDYCSGVPVSKVHGDSLIFGNPETTTQLLNRAIAQFDSAIAHPAVTGELTDLAAVGKGRALLDLGQFAAAAAAVGSVPSDFVFLSEHNDSPASLRNAIFGYTDGFLWSIPDAEGGNGLAYLSANDPRVPYRDEGTTGLDNTTPQFTLLKFPDPQADVPVADGIEARLIEAEAQLQAGSTSGMRTILNNLRALVSLSPLPVPATTTEAEDMLFSERAFWLFSTGHRLGDMRRLIRQYGRAADTVFPVGAYLKGGVYGTDVNLPIPVEELNNPNSQGCLDRNP